MLFVKNLFANKTQKNKECLYNSAVEKLELLKKENVELVSRIERIEKENQDKIKGLHITNDK